MNKKFLFFNHFKYFFIFVFCFLLFLFLVYTSSKTFINKFTFEKNIFKIANLNEEKIFSVDNITLFSSASSDSEIKSNTTLNLKNLYQYTDIALFITPLDSNLTYKNTLKEVYIDNIHFTNTPKEGTPKLYYKNVNSFASPNYSEENIVDDKLFFNIASDENADLNQPTLYNNCANPITLSYINSNIKTDFTLPDAFSQITYDGSLLKKCGVTLSSINASISFDIHIKNNLGHEFICPIYIQIPLELKDGSSIYDGKVLYKDTSSHVFYRNK